MTPEQNEQVTLELSDFAGKHNLPQLIAIIVSTDGALSIRSFAPEGFHRKSAIKMSEIIQEALVSNRENITAAATAE